MARVICNCGTVYERSTVKASFFSKASFECLVCGNTLASWQGRLFPTFEVIKWAGWPLRRSAEVDA